MYNYNKKDGRESSLCTYSHFWPYARSSHNLGTTKKPKRKKNMLDIIIVREHWEFEQFWRAKDRVISHIPYFIKLGYIFTDSFLLFPSWHMPLQPAGEEGAGCGGRGGVREGLRASGERRGEQRRTAGQRRTEGGVEKDSGSEENRGAHMDDMPLPPRISPAVGRSLLAPIQPIQPVSCRNREKFKRK